MNSNQLGAPNLASSLGNLCSRYSVETDRGRFQSVVDLFTLDGTLEMPGTTFAGRPAILAGLFAMQERLLASSHEASLVPTLHCISTHAVTFVDDTHATGLLYYQVLTKGGLDHWGRYIDRFLLENDRWYFLYRRVTFDGIAPSSVGALLKSFK
jgi:SnoaL-like domain